MGGHLLGVHDHIEDDRLVRAHPPGQGLVQLIGGLAGKRVAVLVGKGNNGGGGAVAARHMANRGADVVALVAVREGLGETVAARLETLEAMSVEVYYQDEGIDLSSRARGAWVRR